MDPVSKARQEESHKSGKNLGRRPPPPEAHRFKPGAEWRGNAGGRPKRKHFTEMYEKILNDPEKQKAIAHQIFKTMSTKGMAGVLERREAAERVEGKVADTVDLNVTGRITLEQVLEAKKRANK